MILWNKSSAHRLTHTFFTKYRAAAKGAESEGGGEGGVSDGPPDLVCLSYTHDDDYEDYKPYPPGKKPRPRGEAGG